MRTWRKVFDPLDVEGPGNLLGIHRPDNHASQLARTSGRLDQEFLQRWLAIETVRAHVTEIPLGLDLFWKINLWINGAIQRASHWRSQLAFDFPEHWSTCERQVEIVTTHQACIQ